jgi:aspartate/methionine/tyrosine aminotransferase
MSIERVLNQKPTPVFFTDAIRQKLATALPSLTERSLLPIRLDRGAPREERFLDITEKLKEGVDLPQANIYSEPSGELFYRQAISHFMNSRYGVSLNVDSEVMAIPGSNSAIFRVIEKVLKPGKILLPVPGYPAYFDAAKSAGHEIIPLNLNASNNYQPDLDLAIRSLTDAERNQLIAIVINYPNNPTGRGASKQYLEHVADFAKKNDILILSDMAYADIYKPGSEKPHSILEISGAKDFAVEYHSLSKSYSITGDRAGFLVGNELILGRLRNLIARMDISNMPVAVQHAAAFALTDQSSLDWVRDKNAEYDSRRVALVDGLARLGWNVDMKTQPESGFYVWVENPKGENSEIFTDGLMDNTGVITVPANPFFDEFAGPEKGFVRLSLMEAEEKIVEACERLSRLGYNFSK